MAIDLGNPIWVTLVGNEGAPAELVQYHGYRFTWPPNVPPPAQPDTIIISGISLYGYARNVAGEWQWVLQVVPDPNIAAVEAIPGPDGWQSMPARTVYMNTANFLLQAGVTASILRPGLLNLYNAARTELITRGWTGPA